MIKGQKHVVVMTKLQEHLLAKGYDQESVDVILLVGRRTLDCLKDVFRDFFNDVEANLEEPHMGIPSIYVDGVILGVALYTKFLPQLFPEMPHSKVQEVQAYAELVDAVPMVEDDVSSENKPS